jgi:hypothetical protein
MSKHGQFELPAEAHASRSKLPACRREVSLP